MALTFPLYKDDIEPTVKAIQQEQSSGSFFVAVSAEQTVTGSSSLDFSMAAAEGVETHQFKMGHIVVTSEDGTGGLPGCSKFDLKIFERAARLPGDLIYQQSNLDASEMNRLVLNADTIFANRDASPSGTVYVTISNKDLTDKKFVIELRCFK